MNNQGLTSLHILPDIPDDINIEGIVDPKGDQTIWSIIQDISDYAGTDFYYDASLNTIIIKKIPEKLNDYQLKYGENITTWTINQRREDICNVVEIKYNIRNLPYDYDAWTKNVIPRMVIGHKPFYYYYRTGYKALNLTYNTRDVNDPTLVWYNAREIQSKLDWFQLWPLGETWSNYWYFYFLVLVV